MPEKRGLSSPTPQTPPKKPRSDDSEPVLDPRLRHRSASHNTASTSLSTITFPELSPRTHNAAPSVTGNGAQPQSLAPPPPPPLPATTDKSTRVLLYDFLKWTIELSQTRYHLKQAEKDRERAKRDSDVSAHAKAYGSNAYDRQTKAVLERCDNELKQLEESQRVKTRRADEMLKKLAAVIDGGSGVSDAAFAGYREELASVKNTAELLGRGLGLLVEELSRLDSKIGAQEATFKEEVSRLTQQVDRE